MSSSKNNPSYVDEWIEKQPQTGDAPDLSIVIPAFNEQWRLPTTLIDMIDYLDRSGGSYEIIVVDDGSTDSTCEIVGKFEKIRSQVRLISVPTNHGKGYVVRTGMLNARGKQILFADADGAAPIQELARLKQALEQGADIAIGSRALFASDTKVRTVWYRKYLGRTFNLLVNFLILPGIADTQCGFKLFRREAARFIFKRQRADRYSFDVEVLYIASRAALKVSEVPINWQNVPGSKVNLLLDSLKMFWDILHFRVRHRQVTPLDTD